MAGEDDGLLRSTVGNELTTGRETHALSKLHTGAWLNGQRGALQYGKVLVDVVDVVGRQRHVLVNQTTNLLSVSGNHRKLAFLRSANAIAHEHNLHLDMTTVSGSSRNLHLYRVQRRSTTIGIKVHTKVYLVILIIDDFHRFRVFIVTHSKPHLDIASLTKGGTY